MTACETSLSARSSSTERASSSVRTRNSSSSRAFSIAITAWSANVLTSSICLSVNGRGTVLRNKDRPYDIPVVQHWSAERGSVATNLLNVTIRVRGVGQYIADVNRSALQHSSSSDAASIDADLSTIETILQSRIHLGRMTEPSQKTQKIAVALEQPDKIGFAQPRR